MLRVTFSGVVLTLVLVGCGEGSTSSAAASGEGGATAGSGMGGATAGSGMGGATAGSGLGGATAGGNIGRGGSGGAQEAPPHVVTDCTKLAAPNVWEQITPPNVDLSTFGVGNVVFDPNNSATLYVGTAKSGLHKSLDCGATWQHVNTGALGADIEKGSVAPVIDPINPNTIYTGSLYGTNGFFRSKDGGKNFEQKLPPDLQQYIPYGGFIGGIAIDPGPDANANLHLIVTWHDVCKAPYNASCYAETFDGGDSWQLVNGHASWSGQEGTVLQFLDSARYIFTSQSNGLWLTIDRGKTWSKVPGAEISHGAGQLYRAANGSFFLGTGGGIMYSPDGTTWSLVPKSGGLVSGLAGNGKHMWSSQSYPYNPGDRPGPELRYMVASESDPMNWKTLDTPKMSSGGYLAYDPDHKLLYSANYWDGVWRVVVE